MTPDPNGIAVEHCIWAAEAGQTPREVLDSVGITWTASREPTWDDARLGLVSAWHKLHAPQGASPIEPGPSLWTRILRACGLLLRAVGAVPAPEVAHG